MRRPLCFAFILVALTIPVSWPNLLAQADPLFVPSPARVFVSGRGSDSNPCSIAAPCRGFQRAHDVVDSGGEIVVLDSAGYGTVSINRSISITSPDGLYAGITAPTGTAIYVHGSGLIVYLRGLTILGAGTLDSTGVDADLGARIVIDRCRISRFAWGCRSSVLSTLIQDTIFDANTTAIRASSPSPVAPVTVSVVRSSVTGSDTGIDCGAAKWTIRETLVQSCGTGLKAEMTGLPSFVFLKDCTFVGNTVGLYADNSGHINLMGTTIMGSTEGLKYGVWNPTIDSWGGNLAKGNSIDGYFTGTYPPD